MKKFGLAVVVASGLFAGIIGIAAPAQAVVSAPAGVISSSQISAGVDHHSWLDQIGPHVNVPKVDTTVHQSR